MKDPVKTVSKLVERPQKFLTNVFWNWVAVAANIFTGIILTRYIIRKLGDERYGVWALIFSLIEYVFLFDLGFRSAIVTFVSRLKTKGDTEGVNQIINTALAYFGGVAVLIAAITLGALPYVLQWFKISEAYRTDFAFLLTLVGLTWAIGIISNVFQASLEASQNFRTYSHILVIMLVLRSGGCALLLYLGFGLKAMGIMVASAQLLGYALMFAAFLKAFPQVRFARSLVKAGTWAELAKFGVHSLVASSGVLFLNQGPPVLIGHFQSEAFVGYYMVPMKLLQYIVDMVTRIGFVTVPKTAELLALGKTEQIARLGMFINRYCLALFLPITIFLGIYGTELIALWLGPTFATQSGPLVPVFVTAIALAVAGQFNSSQLLFGMGVHQLYAKTLVVESIALIGGMLLVLPRYGIFGAACLSSALMLVNRGLITPLMTCHHAKVGYLRYMAEIYLRPLLAAIPVVILAWWMKSRGWLVGRTWLELIVAGGLITIVSLVMSYFISLDREHRDMLWDIFDTKLRRKRPVIVSA